MERQIFMQSLTKKGRSRNRQSNKFNYQLQNYKLQDDNDKMTNLHHTYFELYDKYANKDEDILQSISDMKKDQTFNIKEYEGESLNYQNLKGQQKKWQSCSVEKPMLSDKWLIQENKRLLLQNTRLSRQLLHKNLQNEDLKRQISQCKAHLSKIRDLARFEDMHHKDSIFELTDQIQLILLDNQKKTQQLRQLRRIISSLNQEKYHSPQHFNPKERQFKSKSLTKEIKYQNNASMHQDQQYNHKKMTQLFNSIKEMYKKIMGLELTSLKQLWRWLKGMGQSFSSMKQWKNRARSVLKTSLSFSLEKYISLLDEICEIIA